MPTSNELLICTNVRGDVGIQLSHDAADLVFDGTPNRRMEPLRYASCLRLPVRPVDPISLPPDGTRCQLVWPPKRWWPVSIGHVPVAFSMSVSRHSEWTGAQFFIEAHIGHQYLNVDDVGRRDLYGSDLRYLRPLLHAPMREAFTGAVVTKMVQCAKPGGFLANGAVLGVEEGVFVRDELGKGHDIDGEVVFDMQLPNSASRIVTMHSAPYFIPVAATARLGEDDVRLLVRDERRRLPVHRATA